MFTTKVPTMVSTQVTADVEDGRHSVEDTTTHRASYDN